MSNGLFVFYKIIYDLFGIKVLFMPISGLIWVVFVKNISSSLSGVTIKITNSDYLSNKLSNIKTVPWFVSIVYGILLTYFLLCFYTAITSKSSFGYEGFAVLWLIVFTPFVLVFTYPVWAAISLIHHLLQKICINVRNKAIT